MESEELSFGGGPEREPRLRAWVAAHTRLLAACTAVLAVFGLAGAGGWYLQHRPVSVSPPPAGPWPEGGTFTAFICDDGDTFSGCSGEAVTAEERDVIEARLRAMPEVAEVAFESQAESWENFKEVNTDNEVLLSALNVEDMPESFRGRLHRRADLEPFESALEKMTGLSNVFALGYDFWAGKADVAVILCRLGQTSDSCSGPATAEQKEAIETSLVAFEGIEHVYFEDAVHATRAMRHWRRGMPFVSLRQEFAPESYRVKLANPGAGQAVIDAVKGMPGVDYTEVIDAG